MDFVYGHEHVHEHEHRGHEHPHVHGLETGADDYIAKPFEWPGNCLTSSIIGISL